MLIIPAMDLIGGECVRLRKGNFKEKTRYDCDPLSQAKNFEAAGAKWLHVVDLDGAKTGRPQNLPVILNLAQKTNLKIQLGGGLRDISAVENVLEAGINRAVIGSLAVKNPSLVSGLSKTFGPGRLVVALDVFSAPGRFSVAKEGWQKDSHLSLDAMIPFFLKAGIRHFLVTDISRDGMLLGPNAELYKSVLKNFPGISLQASGGVASGGDIKDLEKTGVSAAIVGKAIYEGRLPLKGLFRAG